MLKMPRGPKKAADVQLHQIYESQKPKKVRFEEKRNEKKRNKSSKDRTWSAVPDALLGVIS